jgi:hypothetical protein
MSVRLTNARNVNGLFTHNQPYLCRLKITHMKKLAVVLLMTAALLVSNASFSQKAKWKEMEDFHTVMGATFHPAEEGKLEPIRTRSKEMVDKAKAWEKSTAPEGYDKKAVSATLKKLVAGAKELDKMVKSKADDQALVARLSSLHDVFHEIMEKCQKEGHQH